MAYKQASFLALPSTGASRLSIMSQANSTADQTGLDKVRQQGQNVFLNLACVANSHTFVNHSACPLELQHGLMESAPLAATHE